MMNFEILSLPQKQLLQPGATCYRVYKDAVNFTTVEAANAHEAMQTSGVQHPYRIERDSIFLRGMVDLTKICAPTTPQATPSDVAKQESPAAALTGEQVDKLLQETPPSAS